MVPNLRRMRFCIRLILGFLAKNQNLLGAGIGGTYGSPSFRAHA
jgi:hypothetical protein